MGRTHDVLISEFDLDRLEADLSAAERSAAEQTRRANENHAWALRAERERDTERALAEQRGRLYDTAIRQLKALERDLDRLEAQLDAERALADRLAEAFKDLWYDHTMYRAGYEVVEKALAAWKEARSE